MAIICDGRTEILLCGEDGRRSIFRGSIRKGDGGPDGRPRLILCRGNWLLVGRFDDVDIVLPCPDSSYEIISVPSDCGPLHHPIARLSFDLLEGVAGPIFCERADGIGLSVLGRCASFSATAPAQAIQSGYLLTVEKSIPFLPSTVKLAVGTALTEVHGKKITKPLPSRQCYRQQVALLAARCEFPRLFGELRLAGSHLNATAWDNFSFGGPPPRSYCYQSDMILGRTFIHSRSDLGVKEKGRTVALGLGRRAYRACADSGTSKLSRESENFAIVQNFFRADGALSVYRTKPGIFLDYAAELGLRLTLSQRASRSLGALTDRCAASFGLNFASGGIRHRLQLRICEQISSAMSALHASASYFWCF
jgi:hypothetical protein